MKSIKIMVDYLPYLLKALPTTFYILFVSVIIALLLAMLLTWARVGKNKVAKIIASIYISFMRGTPMIAQILIIFIVFPVMLKSWGIAYNPENNSIFAIIAFSLNEAAFFSEIFRSAYLALDKGQIEAGQSLGMTNIQVFFRIILPEGMASALPNTTNMIIELMKNTSLGMAIGVYDIMGKATQLALNNYGVGQVEVFIEVSIMFWIIGLIFMTISDYITKWMNRGNQIGKVAKKRRKLLFKT